MAGQSAKKVPFRDFLRERVKEKLPIFFDGGMGTMIQKTGIVGYKIPEDLNFYHPEIIVDIHYRYLAAGCNIITANSFGANPIKLASETSAHTAVEYIEKAIELQKEAVLKAESDGFLEPHYISWDTGQIGKLLEPMGTLTFDEAYESYKECAIAAEKAGADLAIIETMSDLYEVKAAVLAVKEHTSLPIIADMTFQPNFRTLTGADVLTCVTYLEALRVDVLGFNCGGALAEDAELARQFLSYAHIPVCIEPNAGLPEVVNGKDVYKVEPQEFACAQKENYALGAALLGGCCGTTPSHIAQMVKEITAAAHIRSVQKSAENKTQTYICSYNKTQPVGGFFGPVIIGERINPTGKKKCKEALQKKDFQYILSEAESQIAQGAHLLDVNMGLPGIDEKEMMVQAVRTIQSTFTVPLQLDSSEAGVLEKALRYYNGKALVNSVNGKQEVMDAVFPLIKHYGGAVVALCIDESGIAPTAEGRVAVAKKIIAEAKKYDIPVRDIFIDTLTLTVSSEQKAALETVRAMRLLKAEFGAEGLQFVLGVSNISFGLPRRDIVNSRFFMLALDAGLTGCIINPASAPMMDTFFAYRSLSCFDENSLDYINTYTGTLDASTAKGKEALLVEAVQKNALSPQTKKMILEQAVREGSISISVNVGGQSNAFTGALAQVPVGSETQTESSRTSAQKKNDITADERNAGATPEEERLIEIIEKGFKDKAKEATAALLEKTDATSVIDRCIVPALDAVGKDFENGKKFLPQLLLSADTVGLSFEKIKETLTKSGQQSQSKGTIVIATVYGDIHDIGKNIVRAMLENYGYEVIDLGKNVPSEVVVQTVLENDIKLVGLSALMTTTVANMEQTIKDLRNALSKNNKTCAIMVGGAVLTADYAKKIGADYYSKDAMESVAVAKEVFGA